MHKVVSKYCGGVDKGEFWNEWDIEDLNAAIALIPKEVLDKVVVKYTPISEMKGGF